MTPKQATAIIETARRALALIDNQQLAKGIALAAIDHQASYQPSPNNNNGQPTPPTGTHSDPTAARALRPHPTNPDHWLRMLDQAINHLWDIHQTGNTDPSSRPETGSPCRGGQTHQPDDTGTRCALESCGKLWPCNPAQPNHYWEPCTGILTQTADRCPRCELARNHWICKDCPTGQDVHTKTTKSYLGLCRPHYDRQRNNPTTRT